MSFLPFFAHVKTINVFNLDIVRAISAEVVVTFKCAFLHSFCVSHENFVFISKTSIEL